MKNYVLANCGVEHFSITGVYESKEQAMKDADFVVGKENELSASMNDNTFRTRFVKRGDMWREQTQHKFDDEPWGEWPDIGDETYHDKIIIVEHDTATMSFQDKWDAINEWQNSGHVHQLTCGKDSNHPSLVPYYDFCWRGIGIKCIANECDWAQNPSHSILNIVYATYLSNRASTR
jgi:hypothetical protein